LETSPSSRKLSIDIHLDNIYCIHVNKRFFRQIVLLPRATYLYSIIWKEVVEHFAPVVSVTP
jgi:hypothetical protein